MLCSAGGCAAPVAARNELAGGGSGGGGGGGAGGRSALFLPGETLAALGGEEPGLWPEGSRRDGALSLVTAQAITASDQWPEPERASIERYRTVRGFNSYDSFVFFLPEQRRSWRGDRWYR